LKILADKDDWTAALSPSHPCGRDYDSLKLDSIRQFRVNFHCDIPVFRDLIVNNTGNMDTLSRNLSQVTITEDEPLLQAAERRDGRGLETILDRGADINTSGKNGTALHIAARKGFDDLATVLISRGADLESRTSGLGLGPHGHTALLIAARRGYLGILKSLVKAGADTKAQTGDGKAPGMSALKLAAQNTNIDVVEYLLSLKDGFNEEERSSALTLAIRNWVPGRSKVVRLLCQAGASKESLSEGLHVATEPAFGTEDDDEEDHPSSFHAAHLRDQVDVLDALLEAGADPDCIRRNHTVLYQLAFYHQGTDAVTVMLNRGADPNVRGPLGKTALMTACATPNFNTVKLLLERGADIAIEDDQKRTVFHLAAQRGDAELFLLLIHTKYSVDNPKSEVTSAADELKVFVQKMPHCSKDQTPLDVARAHSNSKIVALLTRHDSATGD
jgi:ankyrin repeat protein